MSWTTCARDDDKSISTWTMDDRTFDSWLGFFLNNKYDAVLIVASCKNALNHNILFNLLEHKEGLIWRGRCKFLRE